MIRATYQVIRAIHTYRNEFSVLFNEYTFAKKKINEEAKNIGFHKGVESSWISLTAEAKKEYLSLVEKYLQVKKFPNNNRPVTISTHNGGKHVGFYEEGQWWYSTLDNPKVLEKAIVIKWQKN